MRQYRIYTPQPLATGETVCLDTRAAHHLLRVLRARAGTAVKLFNGDGYDYLGQLADVQNSAARVDIEASTWINAESPLRLTLAQGIARGERMDYTLQKAVELGVDRVVPLFCERSEVKLSRPRLEKRMDHWRGVIVSACEQSGRGFVPDLSVPCALSEYLETKDTSRLQLVLSPHAPHGIKSLACAKQIELLVGPEGGLSKHELELAEKSGFGAISLGPRVLRTETAGPAALAALQALWGDMG